MTDERKLNNGLGTKIAQYIKSKGLKQTFVAYNANLSDSHLCNVLKDRVVITPDVLEDINKSLGTNFSF